MLIDLTVRGPHGDRDVRLDAPPGASVGALRSELARVANVPPDTPFFLDDVELADDTLLADTGLRSGSVLGVTPTPPARSGHPYVLRVAGGPAAGRVHPLHRGRVSVGRGAECDITLDDARVSRLHVSLQVTAGRVVVLEHGSTNGSTIDGEPVRTTGATLAPGAVLQLGDSLLSVAAPSVGAATTTVQDGTVLVHRPPRPPATTVPADVVDLPDPPARGRPHPVQWVAAVIPALAAGGLAWATGSTVFLLFGLLSPLMLLSTAFGDRWQGRRSRRRAAGTFRAARDAAVARLAAALADETEHCRAAFPDPAVLALVADTPGTGLWGRGPTDDDWLVLRVGCGSVPSRTLVREAGRERPGSLLRSVPVVVDLGVRPLGLAGPAAARSATARWWVAQLAVHHSPEDVSVVVLATDGTWAWSRWLPHVRVVTSAEERADVVTQLRAEVDHRLRRRDAGVGPRPPGPAVVLVVEGAIEPALADLVAGGAPVGVTALWLRTDPGALPSGCTAVLAGADGQLQVAAGAHDPCSTATDLVADTVTTGWAERVARSLAPLVDLAGRRAVRLPVDCTLTGVLGLETADAHEIARAWAGSTGHADTVLGRTGDGVLRVDLDVDGPHALVAGTTGSGKSELLRTLVTGLCLLHPPDELTVLLVDYKGGAAFAQCAALPHCAGLVTDLDARLTARALRSLDAEIRRREVLLRDAGALDLAAYRAGSPITPLARLVIVVDEFATLVDDLPDFVSGLVGIAQRGRSLGVHLVLATQRPGSVVSPEIRANTSLRIALRVVEVGESVDVVGSDDAAAITPATPGRAVLRTGSGLQAFQTARPVVTAPRTATPHLSPLDTARRSAPADEGAGLAHLVAVTTEAARRSGRTAAPSPWQPPLRALVPAASLPHAAFAVADVPAEQRQPSMLLTLDPATSTLLLGTARSGRTTALASMALAAARTHSPGDVELHLVDARGGLLDLVGGLPHVATRLGPDDLELVESLLERLADRPSPRRHLLLMDSWDVALSMLGDDFADGVAKRLAALVRAPGPVSVLVSGDRSLIAPRFSGAFDRRLALRLGDPTDYGALGVAVRDLPTPFPPGRGLRAADGVEFQITVPEPRPGRSVADAVRCAVADLTTATATAAPTDAVRLRPLPGHVTVDDLGPAPGGLLRLGLGGDDPAPVTLDPFGGSRRWLVCGPPRSGRSAVLAVALVEAVRIGCPVLVAAPPRSPLTGLATRLGVSAVAPAGRVEDAELRDLGVADATLVLIDDTDAFLDTDVGDALLARVRDTGSWVSVLATGRPDELALAYRGLAAEVRRSRSGIVLRPGPVDGELFGVRLPRARPADPPGRGRLIGDPAWSVGGVERASTGAVRIQIAVPP